MAEQTALGATWEISAGEPATYDDTGFAALTYTEIGKVESLGSFGASFEDVSYTLLKTGLTKHRKGAQDNGGLTVSLFSDDVDTGQILIDSGVDGAERDTVFSHKVTLQGGEIRYFTGQIFSAPETVGGASAMVTKEVNVFLDGDVIKA